MKQTFSHRPTTLADYLAILRRRKWFVLLPPIFGMVVSLFFSMGQSPLYSATAQVLVNRASVVSAITGVDPTAGDPNRFLTTQASIARSPELAKRVSDASGIPGMTPRRVLLESKVTPSSDSDLLALTVHDRSRNAAVRLVNTYATQFTEFSKKRATSYINEAVDSLQTRIRALVANGQANSPLYATLIQQQGQLATVGKLLAGSASVLQPAQRADKIKPQPKRDAALGFLLGVVVGLALAFIAEAHDRKVHDEHEIDDALGLPLLARLPTPSRALRKGNDLIMLRDPESPQAEAFRKLRISLEFVNPPGAARTILITSAVAQEGKSTTIANLAVALARGNRRVALVDLDLRRPYLSRLFHIGGRPGITDVAVEQATLEEALRPIGLAVSVKDQISANGASVASNGRGTSHGVLHVLPSGTIPPTAGEFMRDERLLGVLDELATKFDFVLVDAPPLLAFGDAMTLTSHVDAMFAVTRLNRLERPVLHEFARQLEHCQAKVLGYVLTGVEHSESYRYMYDAYEYHTREVPSARDKERV
jgi:succinoglycan biosynthesis transport protein ExoP